MEQAKVRVSAEVMEGLEAVRQSGRTNMLDAPRVIELAFEMGHYAAALWVRENRREYAEAIFKGLEVAEGSNVACVDR